MHFAGASNQAAFVCPPRENERTSGKGRVTRLRLHPQREEALNGRDSAGPRSPFVPCCFVISARFCAAAASVTLDCLRLSTNKFRAPCAR